jgi:hypothetical protein
MGNKVQMIRPLVVLVDGLTLMKAEELCRRLRRRSCKKHTSQVYTGCPVTRGRPKEFPQSQVLRDTLYIYYNIAFILEEAAQGNKSVNAMQSWLHRFFQICIANSAQWNSG